MGEITLLVFADFGEPYEPTADDVHIAASVTGDVEALKVRAQADADERCEAPPALTWTAPAGPGFAHVSNHVQPRSDQYSNYFYYIQQGIPLIDEVVSAAEVREMIAEAADLMKADRG